jgi:plasmid stabilization system protein ParE
MSRFVFSPDARQDLHDIWDYIAQDSVGAADRFCGRIRRAIEKLARMPGMGSVHPDLADETLCVWPVGSCVIIYRAGNPMEVVRIVSGYRDFDALFP